MVLIERRKMVAIIMENGQEDRRLEVGEFLWVQLTYTDLRAGNDDEEWDIAWIDEDGDWFLNENYAKEHDLFIGPWSDIIIG